MTAFDTSAAEIASQESSKAQRAQAFRQSVIKMREQSLTSDVSQQNAFAGGITSYRQYLESMEAIIVSPIQLANSQLDYLFGTAGNLLSSARDITRSLQSIVATAANSSVNIVYELLRFRTVGLCSTVTFGRDIALEYLNLAAAAVQDAKALSNSGKLFNRINDRWNERWSGVRNNLNRVSTQLGNAVTGRSDSYMRVTEYGNLLTSISDAASSIDDAGKFTSSIDALSAKFSELEAADEKINKGRETFLTAVDKFRGAAFYDRLTADATQQFSKQVDNILSALGQCAMYCGRDPHKVYDYTKKAADLSNAISQVAKAVGYSQTKDNTEDLDYENSTEGDPSLYRKTRADVSQVELVDFNEIKDAHLDLTNLLKTYVAIGKADRLDVALQRIQDLASKWMDSSKSLCDRLTPFKGVKLSRLTRTIAALFDTGNAGVDVLDAVLDGAWDVFWGAKSLLNVSIQGKFITLLQQCLQTDLIFNAGGDILFANTFSGVQAYLDRINAQIRESMERIRQAIEDVFNLVNSGFQLINSIMMALLSVIRICKGSQSPGEAVQNAQTNFEKNISNVFG